MVGGELYLGLREEDKEIKRFFPLTIPLAKKGGFFVNKIWWPQTGISEYGGVNRPVFKATLGQGRPTIYNIADFGLPSPRRRSGADLQRMRESIFRISNFFSVMVMWAWWGRFGPNRPVLRRPWAKVAPPTAPPIYRNKRNLEFLGNQTIKKPAKAGFFQHLASHYKRLPVCRAFTNASRVFMVSSVQYVLPSSNTKPAFFQKSSISLSE